MDKETAIQQCRASLTGSLLIALTCCGPAVVAQAPKPAAPQTSGVRPRAPVIVPGGPIVSVDPGKILSLQASAEGADSYQWRLQGKGSIADSNSPVVLYTAPEEGGTMAALTVVARNQAGESPASAITVSVRTRASIPLDALAIPAGWMSGGKHPEAFIRLSAGSNCRPGSRCQQFTYKPKGTWGGIYWWPVGCGTFGTPKAWEALRTGSCAIDLRREAKIGEIQSLSFWARGARGGEVIELRVGGPDILPRPGSSTGKVTLGTDWKPYDIDLTTLDLSRSAGLFVWIATDLDNPQGAVFFLDDLRFEGLKP